MKQQLIPIILTIVTFFGLWAILHLVIVGINLLPLHHKIATTIHISDILVGFTIYMKTSIDFAIFIGNLMRTNPGWKNRIAIEIGTALGNGAGTLLVLLIWYFFKEVPILMAIMIFFAAFVLLEMAEEGFEELTQNKNSIPAFIVMPLRWLKTLLHGPNKAFAPILNKIVPDFSVTNMKKLSWWPLATFALVIPFILGTDDFAGYIPLHQYPTIYGFATGVLLGHTVLNVALFAYPKKTIEVVKNAWIMLVGSIAFVVIAVFGFIEVVKLIYSLF